MPAGFMTPATAHAVSQILTYTCPEVSYAYSPLEFNEAFGPIALVTLARKRADARLERKQNGRLRYWRRHGQMHLVFHA